MGKSNVIKHGMNQLYTVIVGICKFIWTGIGYFQLESHTWFTTHDMKLEEGMALLAYAYVAFIVMQKMWMLMSFMI